jgi:hypothetical protein
MLCVLAPKLTIIADILFIYLFNCSNELLQKCFLFVTTKA